MVGRMQASHLPAEMAFAQILVHQDSNLLFLFFTLLKFTIDFGEVKTALTECKEKCFQMSHLPIFTVVKLLKVC